MSYSIGGLIIKNADAASNAEIISLYEAAFKLKEKITVDEALSRDFRSIGLLRKDNVVFLLGKMISNSLAFSPGQTSLLDDDIAKFSVGHEVLGFLLDGTSDSYAYSIFKNGNRIRVKTYSDGELLLEEGDTTEYDENTEMDEDGLFELMKNFSGHSITDQISDNREVVSVYDK